MVVAHRVLVVGRCDKHSWMPFYEFVHHKQILNFSTDVGYCKDSELFWFSIPHSRRASSKGCSCGFCFWCYQIHMACLQGMIGSLSFSHAQRHTHVNMHTYRTRPKGNKLFLCSQKFLGHSGQDFIYQQVILMWVLCFRLSHKIYVEQLKGQCLILLYYSM